ncbi:hypothetical protein AeRB84_015544 [Aphanomyces euteiches]|nr:hypothetical protein AeRB84_015544 [Aphanomyces euteiches]
MPRALELMILYTVLAVLSTYSFGALVNPSFSWVPSMNRICMNCPVEVQSVVDWPSQLANVGIDTSKLSSSTCTFDAVYVSIVYPSQWTNVNDSILCSVNNIAASCVADTTRSSAAFKLTKDMVSSLLKSTSNTFKLLNLNSPTVMTEKPYSSNGTLGVNVTNIKPDCMMNQNGGGNTANMTIIKVVSLQANQSFIPGSMNATITATSAKMGALSTLYINAVSSAAIPTPANFTLYSLLNKTLFLNTFSASISTISVSIMGKTFPTQFNRMADVSDLYGLSFVYKGDPLAQNVNFTITMSNVTNPSATNGSVKEVTLYVRDLNRNPLTSVENVSFVGVDTERFESAYNTYDLVSTILFGVALIIALCVVRQHGLGFTAATCWTDLVSISVVLGLACGVAAFLLWIVYPSAVFVFLYAAQYFFNTNMIVSLCFHWASVLRLQLFRKLTLKSPALYWYIFILAVLAGSLLTCLILFSSKLDCVYSNPVTGSLRMRSLNSSPPSAIGNEVLDSLAMCSMNGYYMLIALGLIIFTVFLISLGGSVMVKGRKLMLNDALPIEAQSAMRKALTIFYCIIASTVVIYVIAVVIYIASYIISKTIENDYRYSGRVAVSGVSDGSRVSTVVWYLFTIWLPQCVPPVLLLFLHYTPNQDDARGTSVADDNGTKPSQITTPGSDRVGELTAFSANVTQSHRRFLNRTATFLEDSANKLHVIVKLKVPEGSLTRRVYVTLDYCTLKAVSLVSPKHKEWKFVEGTERVQVHESEDPQFRSSTLGMVNVPFVAVLSVPVAGLAANTLLRFIVHAEDENKESEFAPILEFVTTPQAVMDAASHSQALTVRAAEESEMTLPELLEQRTHHHSYVAKMLQSSELHVTTVLMDSIGPEAPLSHHNMGNIVRYFQFEPTNGDAGLVVEDLKESRFCNLIPRQFLECLAVERADDVDQAKEDLQAFLSIKKDRVDGGFYNQILQTIQEEGDYNLTKVWLEDRLQRRKEYLSKIRKNVQFLVQRDKQKQYFKASVDKKTEELKFVPVNLHVEDMLVGPADAFVNEEKRRMSNEVRTYDFTTVGAMAAHCYKFKSGGLMSLQNKLGKMMSKHETTDVPWDEQSRHIVDLTWFIKIRKDVCFSQALTALVASFVRKVEMALQHSNPHVGDMMLLQWSELGFLFQVESLLSTHGNEIGMIEDMSVALDMLSVVAFRLVDTKDKPNSRFSFRKKPVTSSSEDGVVQKVKLQELPQASHAKPGQVKYVVTLQVQCGDFELPQRLANGGEISVFPVLFTQGINEMQTIANNTERAKTELQDTINIKNLQPVEEYSRRYISWIRLQTPQDVADGGFAREDEVDKLLSTLRSSVEEAASSLVKTKRTDILTKSSDLCREMGGGRVTICKSAKDRTAMSVTLEQGRLLMKYHGMGFDKFAPTVAAMRSKGVRIENALKNTGKKQFAFNKLQRYAMPEDYRCPENVGGSGNIS